MDYQLGNKGILILAPSPAKDRERSAAYWIARSLMVEGGNVTLWMPDAPLLSKIAAGLDENIVTFDYDLRQKDQQEKLFHALPECDICILLEPFPALWLEPVLAHYLQRMNHNPNALLIYLAGSPAALRDSAVLRLQQQTAAELLCVASVLSGAEVSPQTGPHLGEEILSDIKSARQQLAHARSQTESQN